jgi:hypothetical protein
MFGIGLAKFDRQAQLSSNAPALGLDIGRCLADSIPVFSDEHP